MAERKAAADKKANRRGAARLAAVQALYQMDIAGAGLNDIFAEFESHWLGGEVEGDKYLPAEAAFFRDVVAGVVRDQSKLDPLIDDALSKGWPLQRIDAILRAVLRAGSYELEHRKDVPGRPFLYGTTPEFLQLFNLKDLTHLPTLKEMEEMNLPEMPGEELPLESAEDC